MLAKEKGGMFVNFRKKKNVWLVRPCLREGRVKSPTDKEQAVLIAVVKGGGEAFPSPTFWKREKTDSVQTTEGKDDPPLISRKRGRRAKMGGKAVRALGKPRTTLSERRKPSTEPSPRENYKDGSSPQSAKEREVKKALLGEILKGVADPQRIKEADLANLEKRKEKKKGKE